MSGVIVKQQVGDTCGGNVSLIVMYRVMMGCSRVNAQGCVLKVANDDEVNLMSASIAEIHRFTHYTYTVLPKSTLLSKDLKVL